MTNPLLEPPVATVPEVLDRMEAIQRHVERHEPRGPLDGVACFNFLYRVITDNIFRKLGESFFEDGDFIDRLDVAFANRYFDALRAHAAGDDPGLSRSWAALIERRSARRVAALQFAVAGVNAHVNLDLALALVATFSSIGVRTPTATQRRDYDRVNLIFGEEMARLRDHLQGRLEDWVDERAGEVDDAIGNWSIVAARDAAWANGDVVRELRRFGIPDASYVRALDRLVGLAGRGILTSIP